MTGSFRFARSAATLVVRRDGSGFVHGPPTSLADIAPGHPTHWHARGWPGWSPTQAPMPDRTGGAPCVVAVHDFRRSLRVRCCDRGESGRWSRVRTGRRARRSRSPRPTCRGSLLPTSRPRGVRSWCGGCSPRSDCHGERDVWPSLDLKPTVCLRGMAERHAPAGVGERGRIAIGRTCPVRAPSPPPRRFQPRDATPGDCMTGDGCHERQPRRLSTASGR